MKVEGQNKIFSSVVSILNKVSTDEERNKKMLLTLETHQTLSHERRHTFENYFTKLNVLVDKKNNYQAVLEITLKDGANYKLTMKKFDGNYENVLLEVNAGEKKTNLFSFFNFKNTCNSEGTSAFLTLLSRIEGKLENFKASKTYAKEAEAILEETYVNFCLDNRRFDLLKDHLEAQNTKDPN